MQNKPFTWPTNLPTWLEVRAETLGWEGEEGIMLFMKLPKREYLSQLGDCLSISIQLETRTASAVQRERVRERKVEQWEAGQ